MDRYFANQIFMVRPRSFGLNSETSETNAFQSKILFDTSEEIQKKALIEFDVMVQEIRANGVFVQVFQDNKDELKPDAVFPNNWITTHPGDRSIVYPMLAINRRLEYRKDIVKWVSKGDIMDLRSCSDKEMFLEGTGSMVIDHESRVIYVARSPRTHLELVKQVAKYLNFSICSFLATDHQNNPIYHTNVVMFVTQNYVGVSLDTIQNETERNDLIRTIQNSGKEIFELSYYQITQFSGNMIQVLSDKNEYVLITSLSGWNALESDQKRLLEKYSKVVSVEIPTIETYGGGSARCMIAEVFRS
jgi:hypothetical protein